MEHNKKQDDDNKDTPVVAAAVAINAKNNSPQRINPRGRSRSGTTTGALLVNTGLSVALFFALVQFFDPTLRQRHENEAVDLHLNHNPVLQSLTNFAHGKDNIKSTHSSRSELSSVGGRERILSLLNEAGIAKELSDSEIERLPKWEQVSS